MSGNILQIIGTNESIEQKQKESSEDVAINLNSKKDPEKSNSSSSKLKEKRPSINLNLKLNTKKSSIIEGKSNQFNIIYEESQTIIPSTLKTPHLPGVSRNNSRKSSKITQKEPKTTEIIASENKLNESKSKEDQRNVIEEIKKIMLENTNESSSESSNEENNDRMQESTNLLGITQLKKERDFKTEPASSRKLTSKDLTSPMGPAFALLKKVERNFSVNAEAANYLLSKLLENEKKKNLRNSMTKNNILKMIASIYSEKLLNSLNNLNNPLHVLIYDIFLNKYGLKKIAENKFKQVIL